MVAGKHIRIGAHVRHAREHSCLSLEAVAERAGVSKSFLSRVGRDSRSPSIASLEALCAALGLLLTDRFREPATTLVRGSDRPRLRDLPRAPDVGDTLITPADERHVTVLESAVPAGGSGGGEPYTLPSERRRVRGGKGARILWILAPELADPQGAVR